MSKEGPMTVDQQPIESVDGHELRPLDRATWNQLDVEGQGQLAFVVAVSATGKITYFHLEGTVPTALNPLEGVRVNSTLPVAFTFFEASPGCAGSTHGGDGGRFCP